MRQPASPVRRRARPRRAVVATLSAATGLLVGAGAVLWAGQHYEVYAVSGPSMEPGLDPGARIVVELLDDGGRARIARGDVVLFPDPGSWADHAERTALGAPLHGRTQDATAPPDEGPATVVKRVVALPGERVVCCSRAGKLLIDGNELDEPYLHPSGGRFASGLAFDTVVPDGAVWVLGDHRAVSRDSRSDPAGELQGAVDVDDLIGVVRTRM
ncbi:signal peptidase I [Georgenia wangjunii]|uniref:signal peptidase I n=1 Tax=Georgenia wangjunii TaxID=3117730 RepID=UPI002F268E72